MGAAQVCGAQMQPAMQQSEDIPDDASQPEAAAAAAAAMAPTTHVRYVGDGNPDRGLSTGDLVLEALREHQHLTRPAQIDAHYGTAMSFRELLEQTVFAAEGWKALGLGLGDTIAVVSRNYHEVFPLILGAVCAGITVTCAVPSATVAEMQHALALAQPKVVVSEADRLALSMQAAPAGASHLQLRGDAPAGVDTYLSLLRRGQDVEPRPDPDTYRAADVGDHARHAPFILFSSGTTGLPKGVKLRDTLNTLLVCNLGTIMPDQDAPEESKVILISSPMCWITGVWQLVRGVVCGNTRVFTTVTDDLTLMATIEKYKVYTWLAAPAVLLAFVSVYLAKYKERYDLSSLGKVLIGGSPTSAEVQVALAQDLGCDVVQLYGATEAGMVFGPDENGGPSPPGSMGKLVPWVELRLVNPNTGEDIPPSTHNVVGEVRVRSPYLLHSYVNNPEETAKAHDELGFYKTGDLVYEADDGYFYFVDRIKEMMKYNNNQIAPAEIEMVLLQHPGVREACVVGTPSEKCGDVPTAFVARAANEQGDALSEDELKDLVAGKLSDYKRLRGGVFFLDRLPKTVSGKIARRELKEMVRAMA